MKVGSRADGRSAIDAAAQDVEAPDAAGLLAECDGEKCCAGRQVVRQVGRGGAPHSIARLLLHEANSTQPQWEWPFTVAFATGVRCVVRKFPIPTTPGRSALSA